MRPTDELTLAIHHGMGRITINLDRLSAKDAGLCRQLLRLADYQLTMTDDKSETWTKITADTSGGQKGVQNS